MNDLFKMTVPLYLLVIGVLVVVLQNAGIILPHKQQRIIVSDVQGTVAIANTVAVQGTVDIGNTVPVQGTVGVEAP